MYIFIHTYIHTCIHLSLSLYTCIYIYIYIYTYEIYPYPRASRYQIRREFRRNVDAITVYNDGGTRCLYRAYLNQFNT